MREEWSIESTRGQMGGLWCGLLPVKMDRVHKTSLHVLMYQLEKKINTSAYHVMHKLFDLGL